MNGFFYTYTFLFIYFSAWESAIANGRENFDIWFNYITWYEQNITHDTENNYIVILERLLTTFEHNETYKQDSRMVKLWIKYVSSKF